MGVVLNMRRSGRGNGPCRGFTLLEVMLSVTILLIVMVPMAQVFAPAFTGADDMERRAVLLQHARGKMEEMLAMAFEDIPLGTPLGAPYSDTVTYNGTVYQRTVTVVLADADVPGEPGYGTPDEGLKKITVNMDDVELASMKARW